MNTNNGVKLKTSIKNLIPRHRSRILRSRTYWRRRKTYPPIDVAYAKDIDKFVILNGHHRYFVMLEKDIKEVDIKINRVIDKTEFDKYRFAVEV